MQVQTGSLDGSPDEACRARSMGGGGGGRQPVAHN